MTTTLDNQINITDAVHSSGVNEEPPLCKAEPDLFTGPVNGITGVRSAVDIFPKAGAAPPVAPAPKLSEGWSGNSFYIKGKRYVVALSPEISKNGLHELRTYCFTGDKQAVPSEKLTTIVTEPLKQKATIRTTGALSANAKNNGRKCAFCQKNITWGNQKTKYCSDTCQTAAYRQRKDGKK